MVKVVRQIIAEQSRKVVKAFTGAFTGKHKFLLYCGENMCVYCTLTKQLKNSSVLVG